MQDDDAVFHALADASRRTLLDRLHRRNGQSLRDLCADLDMTRQAVSKHLAVLERAGLVVVLRDGRERRHYLNPAPIADLAGRWIGKYERARVTALADVKRKVGGGDPWLKQPSSTRTRSRQRPSGCGKPSPPVS